MSALVDLDTMVNATAGLVKALLEQPMPGLVFDSHVTGTAPDRYALFFLTPSFGEPMLGGQDTDAVAWQLDTQSIGADPRQVRWVQDKVFQQLLDARLSPPGWHSTPIRHTDGQPIDWDDRVLPPLAYAVDVFEWSSNRS